MSRYIYDEICVICGGYVPEGVQVCPQCEKKYEEKSHKYIKLPLKGQLTLWLKQEKEDNR